MQDDEPDDVAPAPVEIVGVLQRHAHGGRHGLGVDQMEPAEGDDAEQALRRLRAARRPHRAARETTWLANVRYTGGVTPCLEVLDSERQLFDAGLGLVRLQRGAVLVVVRPYKE